VSESLESAVERFLEHKRALGRKYHSEEHELRCSSASPASACPAA
jgi:polyphosphate kinase